MQSNFIISLYLLLLISLGYIATDIYLPSLPALTAYFHATENEVQMTLFSYLLSFSLIPLISGPLSDHIGRKKVILAGISLGIIATFAALFAPTIQWLIVARFIQGIGTGAVLISSRAIVSDLFTGKALAKQMSVITMLMPLTLSMAPTLGGFLQELFNWQAVFVFLVIYMVLILFFVISQPESLQTLSHTSLIQVFSAYKEQFKNRLFIFAGIGFVLPSLGLFAYLTTSPFLFQTAIGLSPIEYGALAIYIGATILVTGFINMKIVHHFSPTVALYLGGGLVLLSGILLLIFHFMGILTIWSLLLPTLLFFTCLPFCISNMAAKAMGMVNGHFGAATALLTTFQFFGGAACSFLFSLISDETTLSLALCFTIIGIAFLVNLIYIHHLEKQVLSKDALV